PKTAALVARIGHIDTTITANETEALLLEQSLIKVSRPPYNILLRDDKSYPYVYLSSEDAYPRLGLHRGPKRPRDAISAPIPVPVRYGRVSDCCRRPSRSVNAKTATSAIACAPVCSIRSSAARLPVWALSARRSTPRMSAI